VYAYIVEIYIGDNINDDRNVNNDDDNDEYELICDNDKCKVKLRYQ
jgi:hypothetical protein